ncbi:hypothetical protein [Vibrio fluminensis]|uniref:hypothetical protein n=1 Tax=Vibrio fluminensis TaxID=2783614 RepID=UPI0018879D35|nr:hypothetical protein [Vibrio fluminensis]
MTISLHQYSNSAYDSNQIPPQPPRSKKGVLGKLVSSGQTVLSFTQSDESIPSGLYREKTPSEWQEFKEENKNIRPSWNEEYLISGTLSSWSTLYLFISAGGAIMVKLFSSLFLLTSLIAVAVDFIDWNQALTEAIIPFGTYVTLPAAIIWLQFELCNRGYWSPWYFRWLVEIRKQFEINRRTGMVTLYKGHNKVRYSHPFIEFDCILASVPTQQGFLCYGLVLAHRYNGSKFSVPIGTLIGNSERVMEYHRLWNAIQRYMDVSQPMPDILELEESRLKDPTTAEYDKQTKRKEDYWRSMSDEEYGRTIERIIKKQSQNNALSGGLSLNIFKDESAK